MRRTSPKLLLVSFVPVLLLCFSSCKKSTTSSGGSSVADPSGTNVVNLLIGSGVTLDDTVNAISRGGYGDGLLWYTNAIALNIDANLNFSCGYAAGINSSYGEDFIIGCSNGIINLGPVSGLGAITTHPTSGYSSTSLAQAGAGYVVESVDNNPDGSSINDISNTYVSVPRTLYYRVYVTTTVTNTSNAIAGYTIKYQGPF